VTPNALHSKFDCPTCGVPLSPVPRYPHRQAELVACLMGLGLCRSRMSTAKVETRSVRVHFKLTLHRSIFAQAYSIVPDWCCAAPHRQWIGSIRQPLCLIARRVPLGTVCVWFASLKNDVTGPRVLVVPAALCQQNGAFSRRALADWEGSHSLHRSTDGACDRSTARETYPSGPSSRKARRHHFAATR
jgi:hypothetical protein